MVVVKVATRSNSIMAMAEAEEVVVEADTMVAVGVETGHGMPQTIIITKDLLMHSRRHQTLSSRISPSGFRATLKVRAAGLLLLWIILFRQVYGTYDNLEFDQWDEIE